jgi:proliferating cell nuclear antigen
MGMPKEVFESYEGDIHDIGIDLEALKKIIARSKGDEKLILELDDEKNKLNVTFKSNVTRKFSIALYDVSSSNLKVPDISYPNQVSIKAGAFVEALKDAELVNDHITLKVDEDKFVIYSKGDLNQSETVFENNNDEYETLTEFKMSEPSKSTFNLAYLKDLTKSTSAEDILKIYLGSDMPVKIEYEVSGSKLVFLLAPRIES